MGSVQEHTKYFTLWPLFMDGVRPGFLLFTTKFQKIPGTYLTDLGRLKGWVNLGATQRFWTRDPNNIHFHYGINSVKINDQIFQLIEKPFQKPFLVYFPYFLGKKFFFWKIRKIVSNFKKMPGQTERSTEERI